MKGRNPKPDFNYRFHHFFEKIDPEILKYLLNHNVKEMIFYENNFRLSALHSSLWD